MLGQEYITEILCEDKYNIVDFKIMFVCFFEVMFHWVCMMTKESNIFIIWGEKSEFLNKISNSWVFHCIRLNYTVLLFVSLEYIVEHYLCYKKPILWKKELYKVFHLIGGEIRTVLDRDRRLPYSCWVFPLHRCEGPGQVGGRTSH